MNDIIITPVGHGFIAPEITEDNHVLGDARTPQVLAEDDGQWLGFLPSGERQSRGSFDTYGCTVYNTLQPIEILIKQKYNTFFDFSERHIYIESNTKPPGNNPHIIGETIRKTGLIAESLLPFNDTILTLEEYMTPKPMTPYFTEIASKWLTNYIFNHDWVFTNHSLPEKQERMIEALRYSPLGVSVVGWKQHDNLLYVKNQGERDNHWTNCVGYKKNKYWIIYDSYQPFIKYLDWNYDFGFAKRYHIEKITPFTAIKKKSIVELILELLRQYMQEIMR